MFMVFEEAGAGRGRRKSDRMVVRNQQAPARKQPQASSIIEGPGPTAHATSRDLIRKTLLVSGGQIQQLQPARQVSWEASGRWTAGAAALRHYGLS